MELTSTTIEQGLGASRELAAAYQAVWDALGQQGHLPPSILELARLRLAAMHQLRAEMDLRSSWGTGLDEGKIISVLAGRWPENGSFSTAERAVLEFTEIYAQDPGAITDELAAAVATQFGDSGLVCLVEALGFIDGRLRLAIMFNRFGNTQ